MSLNRLGRIIFVWKSKVNMFRDSLKSLETSFSIRAKSRIGGLLISRWSCGRQMLRKGNSLIGSVPFHKRMKG